MRWSLLLLARLVLASEQKYTTYDDASWAVVSKDVSTMLGDGPKAEYKRFMEHCNAADPNCQSSEDYRLYMNEYQPRSMRNFTETGFKKVRVPADVWKLISDFWEANKDQSVVEWKDINPYHNLWDAPPTIFRLDNSSLVGGGVGLYTAVANAVQGLLEDWTGMRLVSRSVYGIRIYHEGSILTPHVDRMPLISSCIVNVAQDVDEDWVLEVYGRDGKAHNVTMQPGDLVLYESHSLIHGRPFPLKGKYFANIFIHFEPLGPLNATELPNPDFPPYIIPGSVWEAEWRKVNPDGWGVFSDVKELVESNEREILEYVATANASVLEVTDEYGWAPVHEAARQGNVDIMKLLYEHKAGINKVALAYGGSTPLDIAVRFNGEGHAVTEYLRSVGAKATADSYDDEVDQDSGMHTEL